MQCYNLSKNIVQCSVVRYLFSQCSKSSHYKLVKCTEFLYSLLTLQREAGVHILALGQVQTAQQTFTHNQLHSQSQQVHVFGYSRVYRLFLGIFQLYCCCVLWLYPVFFSSLMSFCDIFSSLEFACMGNNIAPIIDLQSCSYLDKVEYFIGTSLF